MFFLTKEWHMIFQKRSNIKFLKFKYTLLHNTEIVNIDYYNYISIVQTIIYNQTKNKK